MKKIIVFFALFTANIVSVFALSDIDGSDFRMYIEKAHKEKIISGYQDGTFRPNNPVSFIESLKIIINTGPKKQDMQEQTATMNFAHWYDSYMYYYNNSQKTNEVYFSQNEKITRDFAVYLMLRQLGVTFEQKDFDAIIADFPDVTKNTKLAPYIKFAKYVGITDGYKDGTFGPKNKISRGELTKMVWKSLQENQQDIIDKYKEIKEIAENENNGAQGTNPDIHILTPRVDISTSTVSTSTGQETSSPQKEWLNIHNTLRKKHRVGPLKWSQRLAENAQRYANSCPNQHSKGLGFYGENIGMASFDQSPDMVVNRWYNENKFYDFTTGVFEPKAGHFTQIVWKNTREVGCGMARNCKGKFKNIVVCQYLPAGNRIAEMKRNVFPAR
ncbi:hypothetical protein CSB09_02775 [Candidatus Gracilibacteria bacterium]|nr:MAG: hypothetical protein CSB09_02775 [Candidatus Gracilibacteria bacterium]